MHSPIKGRSPNPQISHEFQVEPLYVLALILVSSSLSSFLLDKVTIMIMKSYFPCLRWWWWPSTSYHHDKRGGGLMLASYGLLLIIMIMESWFFIIIIMIIMVKMKKIIMKKELKGWSSPATAFLSNKENDRLLHKQLHSWYLMIMITIIKVSDDNHNLDVAC